ncbi:MAG TPA: response regulator, partial [Chloroflexota bacterium]|nr:response regulator [Chloroflexota bacterium]
FSALSPTDDAAPIRVADWLVKPLEELPLLDTLERVLHSVGRPPRVLIVEDDVDLARVMTTTFGRHGIETIHAQTSQEAIQLSQESDPDLLVLDLILPHGDGFSVVDWLRQHNRLRSVPVVVYSARDLAASDRDRLRLGYTRFLTKGRISPEQFEEQVISLLRQIMPIRVGVGG